MREDIVREGGPCEGGIVREGGREDIVRGGREDIVREGGRDIVREGGRTL